MSQSNLAEMGFSPEEAERFAAAFRPSWELDSPEDVPTVSAVSALAVAPEPDASEKRALQKTLIMADAPGAVPAAPGGSSGPLPSFDLPMSAPKLPPAPVSESDVMKTAVYKPVNAADIDLPDDLPAGGAPKKSPVLFIGIGIAAVVAIGVGVLMASGSKTEEPTAPAATQAAKPRETQEIPPVEAKPEAPVEAKKPEPVEAKKPEPVKPEPVKPEPTEAKGAPKSGGAQATPKPASPAPQAPVVAKPTTPSAPNAPKPAAAPAAKPGGIVRDTPF